MQRSTLLRGDEEGEGGVDTMLAVKPVPHVYASCAEVPSVCACSPPTSLSHAALAPCRIRACTGPVKAGAGAEAKTVTCARPAWTNLATQKALYVSSVCVAVRPQP